MVKLHSLLRIAKTTFSRFVLLLRLFDDRVRFAVVSCDRMRVAYGALSAVYVATALIHLMEGAVAFSLCTLAAALIYAFICRTIDEHR